MNLLAIPQLTAIWGAAQLAVVCELFKALIQNGVLNQADMVARLDALSADLMSRKGAEHAVPIVDIFRNFVAGKEGQRMPC
jgi:hypothetical protein